MDFQMLFSRRLACRRKGLHPTSMTSDGDNPRIRRPWYKNAALGTGLFLMVLGGGNWIVGELSTSRHQSTALGLVSSRIGRTPSAEEIEIARARMDFYHVVATGGRALTSLGVLIATLGVARQLRS
jgi:hypothetical protein